MNKITTTLWALASLTLVACSFSPDEVTISVKDRVVVTPSDNINVCPDTIPIEYDPDTLTQEQAADLLVVFYEIARNCQITNKAYLELLEKAQQIIDEQQAK